MKSIFCLLICFFLIASTYSQKEANTWYFGKHSGINFNTNPATVLTGGMIDTREGVAVISDKTTGQLLFYTEGTTVWNRNHLAMPNGTGLLGDYSSTQSAVIVPNPGNVNKYYIFTTAINQGFRFSEVDMTLASGLGNIINATKNSLLIATGISTEKVIAARHCNGKDFWVITHTADDNNYYVYLINALGVQPPAMYSLGMILRKVAGDYELTGNLKLSPGASKLANAIGTNLDRSSSPVEILNFNNATGALSGPVIQLGSLASPYGIEFSPNEKLIYVTEIIGKKIHQYNLAVPNPDASKITLATSSNLSYGSLQLGPDGKIYVTAENGYTIAYQYLSLINLPNVPGAGCNYQADAINLGNNGTLIGLPTFPASFLKDTSGFTIQGNCQNKSIDFSIIYSGNIDSVKWNFGDATPVSTSSGASHTYSNAGNYNAQLIIYRKCNVNDTANKLITINPPSATNVSAVLCAGSSYTLPNGNIVNQPGIYTVTLASGFGCDSIVTTNLALATGAPLLGKDTSLCPNINLTLNAGSGYIGYLWQDGSTSQLLTTSHTGTYWVQVTSSGGCLKRDSIILTSKSATSFTLGKDTAICNQNLVTLGSLIPGTVSYLWNTAASTPQITTNQPGNYWLEIENPNGCKSRDTVAVSVTNFPGFTLGNDRTICGSQPLFLSAATNADTYLWSNGATGTSISVTNPGIYWAELSLKGCVKRDSVLLNQNALPLVVAQSSNDINCTSPVSQLSASGASVYTWSPALGLSDSTISNPTVTINKTATYLLKGADTNGCIGIDSVKVTVTAAGIGTINMPNAFSPNGDGRNDCFRIPNGAAMNLIDFSVYNRWGERVFSTNDPLQCWNGWYKGKLQSAGGYPFIINAKTFCGDIKRTGIVILFH